MAHDEWGTPPWLFALLDAEHHFTVDVCATAENAKCRAFFSPAEDGLDMDWALHRAWMNPPYGRQLPKWVAKASTSAWRGGLVVGLLPARTCTAWFHDDVLNRAARIHLIRGRLQFVGELKSRGRKIITPPFGSMIVVWDGRPSSLRAQLARPIDARRMCYA